MTKNKSTSSLSVKAKKAAAARGMSTTRPIAPVVSRASRTPDIEESVIDVATILAVDSIVESVVDSIFDSGSSGGGSDSSDYSGGGGDFSGGGSSGEF